MNKVKELYRRLLKKYGHPRGQWKLWCKRPKNQPEKEEVMIGSILTQNTNWNNAEQAIKNLKKEKVCSLKKIQGIKNPKRLAELIEPSRFYNQKTKYLLNFSSFVLQGYGEVKQMERETLSELRIKMLSVKGLGKETTDSILLYALGKPIFVIDEYTKRFVREHRLTKSSSYQTLQDFFESQLPQDYTLFQDFHALIVIKEQNKKNRVLA